MLAGIVHDLGRFYLLGVAAEHHPELLKDQATLVIALDELDRTAGRRLLEALGLPPTIVDAVAQRSVFGGSMPPQSLSDVLSSPAGWRHRRIRSRTRNCGRLHGHRRALRLASTGRRSPTS